MRYAEVSASERRYLPPAVAVSVVAFALRPPADAALGEPWAEGEGTSLWLPLVRRTRAPFLGQWALPGGPTEWDETLADTALRTLHDAVGSTPGTLEQLFSFGGVERSAEAQRLVTIAYWALYGEHELDATVPVQDRARTRADAEAAAAGEGADRGPGSRRWDDPAPLSEWALGAPVRSVGDGDGDGAPGAPGTDAAPVSNVAWFAAERLPTLAFDHAEIVAYALSRLRAKTEYASVAHRFLGPVFTLGRLRAVTEAVRGQPVDPANFRRQALAQGTLVDTGELETGARHRPARLYRFREPDEPARPGRGSPTGTPASTSTPTPAPTPATPRPAASTSLRSRE